VSSHVRAVCIHGHYYQPPREHPWLGVVEPEPSAAPDPDWNARILRECYAANAAARLLDGHGRLRGVLDNYAWTSFDVGPTLDAWLAIHAPALVRSLVRADQDSIARTGWGNAWAQAYNHPILPLCTPRDVRTQVRWGARAFELRFGRRADGMWLPEMAVDLVTLEALAAEGIALTMLSPHQARRVRPLGGDAASWTEVTAETLDVRRIYRCRLPSGASVDVVFRDAQGSQGLAFGELLRDGGALADRLASTLRDVDDDVLVTAATDGETFGHHHRFGEMAVAYAIDRLRADGIVTVTNPAAFRAAVPPRYEVEIVERSSWSCAHGIERWRDDCGCAIGGGAGWTQAWRRPLRQAIDWLRDELARVFETAGGLALADPWGARDRYIDAVVVPERAANVVGGELRPGATAGDAVQARRGLEMARHAFLMQTSCGWFFDDVAGVEATIVLRQAGRGIELARALGARLEGEFMDRLVAAGSNVVQEGTAADVYRRGVAARPVSAARVAACAVLLDRLGEDATLPGYEIGVGEGAGDQPVRVNVVEAHTGASAEVHVRAAPHGASPSCEVDGQRYGVADLFLVQRARLLDKVSGDALRAVRAARHEALGHLRAVIDPLIGREPALPLELAMLLGYEEAERLAGLLREPDAAVRLLTAEAASLRARGVLLPVQTLGHAVGERLARTLERLPDAAIEAIDLLDFAEASGVVLDLAPLQVQVVRWWQTQRPAAASPSLACLRDRLGISPDLE
jgi:alpha-amylase/alpha-mannosidase (GH57 family)